MARDTRDAAQRHANAILAIILISYFMILLDNSVIFTGLPSIESGMDLSAIELSWVQDAYTLVFGGLLLLAARAGDLVGRRRLFMIGLTIFATASFLVGVAPAGWWLIASRALQGIGAAIVAPTSLSLLTATFPEGRERTRAVAWYGASAGLGASLGLVIGGALTDWVSWRAGFFINVPIGLIMIAAALRFLPETPRVRGNFDLLGAVCATLGIGGLVFGTIHSSGAGWSSPVTISAYVIGVVFLVALVLNESRAAQPIMPLRLFRSSERSGAYATRMLYLGAMIGFFFFTTQFLQGVLGFSPLEAGLAFLPMTVVNFVVAMAVPRMVGRSGNAALLAGGVAVTLIGMAWLSRVGMDDTYAIGVALPMLLIGAGQGMAFAPMTSAGIARVTGDDAGAASGLVNTAHQLGSTLGIAILVAVAANAGDSAPTRVEALADRVGAALTGGAGLLALALAVVLAFILPQELRSRRASRSSDKNVSEPTVA